MYKLDKDQENKTPDEKVVIEVIENENRITIAELKKQLEEVNAQIEERRAYKAQLQAKIAEIKSALNI